MDIKYFPGTFLILYHANLVCANLLFCPVELWGVSPQAGQVLPAEASCAARGHKQLANQASQLLGSDTSEGNP